MLKQEIRILAKKMVAALEGLHPDGALVFFSAWRHPGDTDGFAVLHGDPALAEHVFGELESVVRRLESFNLNPSPTSQMEIERLTQELSELEDTEIGVLFEKVLRIMGPTISGEAILMVAWSELGLYQRYYVDLGGMVRNVVSLFNSGIDSFRKICAEESSGD